MRSLALRLRGFVWISFSVGSIGFFVTFFNLGGVIILPVTSSHTGSVYVEKNCFTSLSSMEWKVITAILHPIFKWLIAEVRDSWICLNSSLTAILRAWKTRIGDFLSKLASSIILRSSKVVLIGEIFRAFTIASAIKNAFFSSAYKEKIFINSRESSSRMRSLAVFPFVLSNRISSGASNLRENPRSQSS